MSLTHLDIHITLPQTDPVVWRRILIPDYADVSFLLRAISLVFSWDGDADWYVDIVDGTSIRDYFEAHDTLELHYQVGEHRWHHVIERKNKDIEVEDATRIVVLVGGEHPAPFDDIGGPEDFARLIELRRAYLDGDEIDASELPGGYRTSDLGDLGYSEDYTRDLLEQAMLPELDTTLSELFTTHYEGFEQGHEAILTLLVQIERGIQMLDLDLYQDYVLMAYGYLSLLLDASAPTIFAHAEHLVAAALVKLIDDAHLGEQEEPLARPELHAAFGVEVSAQPELDALLDTMRPLVQQIDSADAGQRAMDTYGAARSGVGHVDEMSARQSAEMMWRESMGPEMLEWSPQRDFIMYVMCQKFDPTLAPEEADPPDYLFIATDEVQDTVLAMIPWYGELDSAQRHAALCRTVLVACALPSEGEPARPIGIVLETAEEARAVEAFYPYGDTPVMSMAMLEKRMRREAAHKSSTRKKPAKGKTKSNQKKARKRNRKKK